MMKRKRIILAAFMAVCMFSVLPAHAAEETKESKTVTVSARESVSAVPDKASVILEILTEGEDSQKVQEENSEKTAHVIEALEAAGVKEENIRTAYFDISPKYDYSSDTMQIIGYTANNRLEITGQEISEIGAVIAAGNEAGANGADSLSFYCSNYEELYLQALSAAVESADKKAVALASAAGYQTVKAISISEGYQDTSMRYLDNGFGMKEAKAMDDDISSGSYVPVYAGETKIEANVTVIYEMNE